MSDDGRCSGCGSKLPADGAACPYCGAAANVVVAATRDPDAERAAALAAVRAHPSFGALAREVPPVPGMLHVMYAVPIVVGTVFTAVPVVFAIVLGVFTGSLTRRAEFGLGVTIAFMAVASVFALIGVGVIVAGLKTRKKLVGGPIRAVPAVVLAKRTEAASNVTSYYLTLGFEGGERHEFGTLDSVFRSAFEGDAGVAHCRGELLLAFRRTDA